jgi:hypothetical protein
MRVPDDPNAQIAIFRFASVHAATSRKISCDVRVPCEVKKTSWQSIVLSQSECWGCFARRPSLDSAHNATAQICYTSDQFHPQVHSIWYRKTLTIGDSTKREKSHGFCNEPIFPRVPKTLAPGSIL